MIASVKDGALIPRFGRARRDPSMAVLEGFHPLKHAMRFGARLLEVVTRDPAGLGELAASLAPDLAARMCELARPVEDGLFARLAPLAPTTGVIAIAERPAVDAVALLAGARAAPLVLLEDPRDLGNMGACVRVAAGAGAAGVLSTGTHDPWHPDALRGGAGLHFALPVARLDSLQTLAQRQGPLLALDPRGAALDPAALDPRALLAFGTERDGLSGELLAAADARVSIPMRAGVSSLNLATSVAAVLFAWRFSSAPER
jgi:RNA methyltransferase, TrmH family